MIYLMTGDFYLKMVKIFIFIKVHITFVEILLN
jgi:hypothetical protein